jgi:predicted metal-dependent peptidase
MSAKNQSTANDLLKNKKPVDPERLKNFELSPYLVNLIGHEPFYSRILRSMTKIETDKVPTAGVNTTYEKFNLYWNRNFMASLTDRQVIGVLKHECLHLLFEHTTHRKRDPHLIWNYATDLAINTTIDAHDLPEGGLIPGRGLPKLSKEEQAEMKPDQITRYQEISKLIESFPPNKTADWYFEQLMNNETIQDMMQQGEKMMQELQDLLGQMDDHDGWGELTEDERAQVQQRIKELLKDAHNECEASNRWGSVPVELQRQIKAMIHREISWKDILRKFVGFTNRDERVSTITRLNRKYPGVHAGVHKEYKPKIAIYVDESGSVPDEALEMFFGELNSLSNLCDFTLYKFDTEVDAKNKVEFVKGRKHHDLKRTRTGGTDFNAPTKHANDNAKTYDGLIIMTDGGAAKPQFSRLRRCYVLCPGTQLDFGDNNIEQRDFLVKMKK